MKLETAFPRMWPALLAGSVVLVLVNMLGGLGLPFQVHDAWVKLVHYSFGAFYLPLFARVWAGHAWHVALAVVLLAAAWGWGAGAVGWLLGLPARSAAGSIPPPTRALADRWLLNLGLGLGGLALAALGLGLAGLFSPWIVWGMAGAGVARLALREEIRFVFGLALVGEVPRETREARWLVGALGAFGAICLLMALGPEVGWDPAYYHLRLPKLYSLHHKVYMVPYIYPSAYPQTIEMIYGLGWLLGGEGVAKVVNLSFWLLCGLAVLRLGRPCGSVTALRAAALAMTMPLIGTLASENYIDLGVTFFQLLALHWGWPRAGGGTEGGRSAGGGSAAEWRRRSVTAAVLIGLAMGSKYTGIVAAAALGGAMLLSGAGAARVALVALVSAVPVLPWLLKNAVFTGDPVAPFFFAALGKLEWTSGISQAAQVEVIPKLHPATWAERGEALACGLWWFVKTRAFAIFSPFVLGMIPVLAGKAAGYERFLKSYVLVFTAAILVLAPDARYWQPAAMPLCVLVAAAWGRLDDAGALVRRAVRGLAWLSVAFGVGYHLVDMHRMFTVFWVSLGMEPVNIYFLRVRVPSPEYSMCVNVMNQTVPEGERIAVVSDVQAYMMDREAVFDCDAPGSRRWIVRLAGRHRDPEAYARQFRRWRARTVFYIRGKAVAAARGEEWAPEDVLAWSEFWNSRARLKYERGECAIYEIGAPRERPELQLDLPGPQDWLINRFFEVGHDPRLLYATYSAARLAGAESAYLAGVFGEMALEAGAAAPPALAALERATRIAPGVTMLWLARARGLLKAGRRRDALRVLAKAKEIAPHSSEIRDLERELSVR